MSQTVSIILHIETVHRDEFERMFEQVVVPEVASVQG